jgi:hypothetical protein
MPVALLTRVSAFFALTVLLAGGISLTPPNPLRAQQQAPPTEKPGTEKPAPSIPTPANAIAVKQALVGEWSVDKDSLRDAILSDFKRNDQPVADEVVKLVTDLVAKSSMTLDFRADGTMSASAKIVSPIGPSQQSLEKGTWKILGMTDKVATLETTTKDEESGETKMEKVELTFDNGDQIHVKIPSQKAEFKFQRLKK